MAISGYLLSSGPIDLSVVRGVVEQMAGQPGDRCGSLLLQDPQPLHRPVTIHGFARRAIHRSYQRACAIGEDSSVRRLPHEFGPSRRTRTFLAAGGE